MINGWYIKINWLSADYVEICSSDISSVVLCPLWYKERWYILKHKQTKCVQSALNYYAWGAYKA